MQPHAPHSILFLCTCICELTHVCFFLFFSPFGGGRVAVRNIFCATLRPLQPSPHSFLFELLHFKLESHPSMDPPPLPHLTTPPSTSIIHLLSCSPRPYLAVNLRHTRVSPSPSASISAPCPLPHTPSLLFFFSSVLHTMWPRGQQRSPLNNKLRADRQGLHYCNRSL